MRKKFLIVLALTFALAMTLSLAGCGSATVADVNGYHVNVEIENGTAQVEVVYAENGAFTLDKFTFTTDVKDQAALLATIKEAYENNGEYAAAENKSTVKGEYTYTDNAFIVRRMALKYEDGGKEFCYLAENDSSFELSPTIPVVLLYCLLGFCITLFVLAFLMLVIKVLSLVADKIQKAANKKKDEETVETPKSEETAPTYAKGSAGELKLYGVSERDAAMIMAIVADELQAPLNTLRFISITDITDSEVEK